MEIRIRRAQRSDLSEVIRLVRELAIYEKAEHEMWSTLEQYELAFDEKRISCDVAMVENEIVGCTVYYDTFSTWKGKMLYLEDFIVSESYRKYGIGQKLYDAFIEEAKKRDCKLVRWEVLDWNEPALRFYEKQGAIIEKDWWKAKVVF